MGQINKNSYYYQKQPYWKVLNSLYLKNRNKYKIWNMKETVGIINYNSANNSLKSHL